MTGGATQELESPALGRLASTCLKAHSVGIIHLNNDWALTMADYFKRAIDGLSIKVTAEKDYKPSENVDDTAKLSRLAASNPDFYWFGSEYNDLTLQLKQAGRLDPGNKPRRASTCLIKVARKKTEELSLLTLFFAEPRILR